MRFQSEPTDLRVKLMRDDNKQTDESPKEFDFSAYPPDTLFHERRMARHRRREVPSDCPASDGLPAAPVERRVKKERRKRIDPTTFEKQYTDDELEFMNAMQRFKEQSCKAFPTHGEVLKVAVRLGYRKVTVESETAAELFDKEDHHRRLDGPGLDPPSCDEAPRETVDSA
jgi:hypothetical protein